MAGIDALEVQDMESGYYLKEKGVESIVGSGQPRFSEKGVQGTAGNVIELKW